MNYIGYNTPKHYCYFRPLSWPLDDLVGLDMRCHQRYKYHQPKYIDIVYAPTLGIYSWA